MVQLLDPLQASTHAPNVKHWALAAHAAYWAAQSAVVTHPPQV
jgi:hypothetical protein